MTVLRPASRARCVPLPSGRVLLDTRTGKFYRLGADLTWLWPQLDGTADTEKLLPETDSWDEDRRARLRRVLASLTRLGLLEAS